MKKLFFLLVAIVSVISVNAQNVGVGTTVPDSSAVLDIFSTNKGVLIPRVLDTANVQKPLEGLIIYNKNTKSPFYYDGGRWLSLGARLPTTAGTNTARITYQVTGSGFSTTEVEMFSLSHGASNPTMIGGGGLVPSGTSSLSTFNFMKELDINSKSFNLATLLGTKFASIEFKLYETQASTIPYASYRYRNVIFESYQVSGSSGGGSLTESISVAFEIYGFKDWANSQEFGYNVVTQTVTTY